eukprot:TRINITY_DN3514_c0_g1_i1.p1 TRINITY_DN3514_c0_g1~~TRINITY_DN3514_c0_g1_i1.p1  ORF type:complete len:183 (+),score=33.76 TRINITY_DN3514_c0_g1_i1:92-640(+)
MCSIPAPRQPSLREIVSQYAFPDDCPALSVGELGSDLAQRNDEMHSEESATFADSQAKQPEAESPFTTVMLRNIPCRLDKDAIEAELALVGFANTYDYIYFPRRRNKSNLGYGFINFVTVECASTFVEAFNGHIFPGTTSTKECLVSRASIQGREANLAQWSNRERDYETFPAEGMPSNLVS